MPSSGYKWLDLLIAFVVFLIVVWAVITIAGMIFGDADTTAWVRDVVVAAVTPLDVN